MEKPAEKKTVAFESGGDPSEDEALLETIESMLLDEAESMDDGVFEA